MNGARIDCIADTSAVINLSKRDQRSLAVIGNKNFAVTFISMAELFSRFLQS